MDRIHSQSPKREVGGRGGKKKKNMTGITAKFLGKETRGRGGGGEGGGVRNGGRDRGRDELERVGQSGESEENGDGGRQMARDERKMGSGGERRR